MTRNFYLSIAAVITAPIIHYIFKRWAKAEDERVLMISGKATRRTLQVFCIGIVILSLFLFYFKPDIFSTGLNTSSEEVDFPAWVAISSDGSVDIFPMGKNWSIVSLGPGENTPESVKNLTTGNITFSNIFLNNPTPADTIGLAFMISVAALWMLYVVFYDYYSWKYGDFEG
jgi:uncharacterized membrane protein